MRRILSSALFTVFLLASPVQAETPPPGGFADLVQQLSPAVVNISTAQKITRQVVPFPFQLPDDPQFDQFRDLFEQFGGPGGGKGRTVEQEVNSLGSGFIIDPSGYVVTNNHVINDADKIKVILSDNTKLDAKIVARDTKTDLAVLKVESKKPLPAVHFGNSDAARVGDWVLAIGNPFGLGGTVTAGIISARARNIHSGPFDDYIQTDAAINRGNSGGPMFNTAGEVIGINTAIFSPNGGSIGIGFAIPSSLAKPIIDQLRAGKTVQRGWLGVKIQDVNEEVANSLGLNKSEGALILEISKGGPAEKAGLQPGDVILSFDGKPIGEMRTLPRAVAETPIGKKVTASVWHNGKTRDVSIQIGELKDEPTKSADTAGKKDKKTGTYNVIGMNLANLTDANRQQYNIDPGMHGALVVGMDETGEAIKRGIHLGDVIIQVNEQAVNSIGDVQTGIQAAKKSGRNYVLLRLVRGEDVFFVTLPL